VGNGAGMWTVNDIWTRAETQARVQGDASDAGGKGSLRLKLNGTSVNSAAIQQLSALDSVRQRTIATSYLAAGAGALGPGEHLIQAIAKADGSFVHLAMVRDLQTFV